jgi:hypothetical protein
VFMVLVILFMVFLCSNILLGGHDLFPIAWIFPLGGLVFLVFFLTMILFMVLLCLWFVVGGSNQCWAVFTHFREPVTTGSHSLGPCVKIVSILTFLKNRGLMKTVQGIRIFSRKKNPVFKLGSSQQFENNRFSWPVFTSRISKQKKLKKKIILFFWTK